MNCEHCPIKDGDCIARLDPRYAHACAKAERGTASDLAQIRAMTARQGGRAAPEPPAGPLATRAAPAPAPPAPDLIPLPITLEARRRGGLNCPEAGPSGCGCVPFVCRKLGRGASLRDCVDCLGLRPPAQAGSA